MGSSSLSGKAVRSGIAGCSGFPTAFACHRFHFSRRSVSGGSTRRRGYYLPGDSVSKVEPVMRCRFRSEGVGFPQVPGLSGWTGVGGSSIKQAFHVETDSGS